MSELNRFGLGIMLFLLVWGTGIVAIEDVASLFVFLLMGVAGFVCFVWRGE